MAVRYVSIDNELVSAEWYTLLRACRADGVKFNINEGHRTMARQWYFWNLYKSGRGNLAAFPSPYAPHIRTGRIDHALDINNAAGVMRWLHKHGVTTARLTVPGESWHVEASADQLRAAAKKLGGRTLKFGMRGNDVKHMMVLLRGVGRWPKGRKVGTLFGPVAKRELMGYQKSQKLKPDGIYGPTTRKHLEADYKRKHG
jgi:hypothetical protein